MERENITLSLPKDVLRKVKHIAIDRNTSVSGLLASILEELVAKEASYEEAAERHASTLKSGLDLGTGGNLAWDREQLHERRV